MRGMMTYKGYDGSVSYSAEDRVFAGKVEFIRDLVSYEGTDVKSLERGFHEAVDDYLALCHDQGRAPDKPFKGSFNIRIGPALHRRLALLAQERDLNLNAIVVKALEGFVEMEAR